MTMTPEQRKARARKAANTRWSKPGAREQQAAAASAAMYRRAEQQVDPEGILDPAQRDKLAASARRAQAADLQLARLRKQKTTRSRRTSEPGNDTPRKLKSPLRYPGPPHDTPSE
ncbi:MAG: hypothetical protein JO345_32945 [Streptosporangiaceae bacterium]|nr:hypothetical protein [Streptosporangiaceae bacterium]